MWLESRWFRAGLAASQSQVDLDRDLGSDRKSMWWEKFRGAIRDALGLYPTLDLHGYGVREALEVTEHFLTDARDEGIAVVRIVYGKGRRSPGGRGVLRHVVPRWLDQEGAHLVERYERRPDQSGDDGFVVVWLRGP